MKGLGCRHWWRRCGGADGLIGPRRCDLVFLATGVCIILQCYSCGPSPWLAGGFFSWGAAEWNERASAAGRHALRGGGKA